VARWRAAAEGSALVVDAKALLAGAGAGPAAGGPAAGGKGKPPAAAKEAKPAAASAGDKEENAGDVGGCPPLEGAVEGAVVTRFPPEPSGFLHIGHAKAVLLNEYYAKHYKGKLLVRFDDTNPSKEKEEFETNILRDLASLGVKPDAISHSSDHFDVCQDLARKLIAAGNAFMDDTDQATMQEERGNRQESKRRGMAPEESLAWFEKLVKGDPTAKHWCLRAKLDMSSDNGTLRDPVLYRGNDTPHHKTGTRYKCYPTYDFVCPIVDSIEGVTHALRTLEYVDRDAQYAKLQDLMGLRKVRIYGFSKLNFVYTVLSKRKLQWFVDNGRVPDWNDPRFPTVQGVVRRGVSMTALRRFIYAQGASRNVVLQEWDKFWSMNKDEIEPTAPRYQGIAKNGAVKLVLSGGEAEIAPGAVAAKSVPLVPADGDKGAMRPMRLAKTVLLESEDANECSAGDKIILLQWGVVEVTAVHRGADGKVSGLEGSHQPEASVKKIKQKYNWVAETDDLLTATIKEFDHLITKPKIEEGEDFQSFLNPLSVGSMPVLVEPALRQAKVGDVLQLLRRGFFRVDKAHASEESPLELVLIPDGKAKSMSTLSTALPHH
jgi:glutamyl-tRNA synthetase